MLRHRVVFIFLGIIFSAFLVLIFWPRPQPARVTFDLPDGSTIHLVSVKHGKTLRFYEGQFWQQMLFSICRSNIPVRFRGFENAFASRNNNGSLGLELRHYMKNGYFQTPGNGSEHLMQVEPSGKEMHGAWWQTSFQFERVLGVVRDIAEDSFWEFPLSSKKEIHFRLYTTNLMNQSIATNEFTLPNPAY